MHDLYVVDDIVVVHTIYILCCPQHILHSIWISCCPHHILRVVHTIKMVSHSISGICCGESRISVFYAVDTIFICSGGVDSVHMVWTTHMLWTICRGQHVHIPWVTLVMLWVYDVGTSSSDIWCGLPYTVDDRCSHHIRPVVHNPQHIYGVGICCGCTWVLPMNRSTQRRRRNVVCGWLFDRICYTFFVGTFIMLSENGV